MEKILLFIAFLVVYILYLTVSVFLLTRFLNKIKKVSFIENEVMIVVPYLFFFAFVFLAGRFFNLHLLGLTILFSNIGLLITVIVWSLIGNPKTPFKEIGGWAGSDFAVKNVWLTFVSQGLVLTMIIAYPILIGVTYFSHSTDELIRVSVIKYSLILLLGSYLLTLPLVLGVLSSGFIDEDTRARYFMNQFSSLIGYSLFISLLFWLFNWGKSGHELVLGNLNFNVSPEVFLTVLIFMLAFLFLPYFIGIQKARRLKNEFLEINKRLLSHIVDTINLATEDNLVEKIENLEQEIISEYNSLVSQDKGVETGIRFDAMPSEGQVSSTELLQYKYYKVARPYDSRLVFYDFLNETYQKLIELKDMELAQHDPGTRKLLADKYVAHFKNYKEDLLKKDEAKGKSNPALWIGIMTILSPVLSQVISEVGKYLINIFKQL